MKKTKHIQPVIKPARQKDPDDRHTLALVALPVFSIILIILWAIVQILKHFN